jgi:hypothetical protein
MYLSLYPPTNKILKSVWWNWTAPQSGLVTVEKLSDSIDAYDADGVAIYDTTNVFSNIEAVAVMKLDQDILCQTLSFSAGAGSNYQIQLVGTSPSIYQLGLTESNAPLILQQPRTVTVSSNASTLFMVVGEGYRPLSYQWQYDGTNIPGQTVAMLALTNIDGSQAGNYTVVITNVGGAVTSAPAALIVSSTDVQPSLTAISDQAGQFSFGLIGEIGRDYRIESSSDMVQWSNETTFQETIAAAYPFPSGFVTSVVFNTNGSSIFLTSNNVGPKFLRAVRYQPANEICINNLRQIRFAKALWLRGDPLPGQDRIDTPGGVDLAPYFLQGNLPYCPDDVNASFFSSYAPGKCPSEPLCIIVSSTHILEEQQ